MASNASRGAAAKSRTKKWLIARGYQVADMEITRTIWKDGRPAFTVKKDQYGADVMGINDKRTLLCQVKSGESARTGTFPSARREFAKYPWPPGWVKIIVAWPPRAQKPRIVRVESAEGFTVLQ